MWGRKKNEACIDFNNINLDVLEAYANASKDAHLIIQVNTLIEVRAIRTLLEETDLIKQLQGQLGVDVSESIIAHLQEALEELP